MKNVLFICSRNRWRSPTAEQIFANYPGIECDSAGLSPDAENPLGWEAVEWADLIFIMERHHKTKLNAKFGKYLNGKKIICLDIPDNYPFMDPKLVELLETKVRRLLQ